MAEDFRPIICKSLVRREVVPGQDGGIVGYRDVHPALNLEIRLRAGRVEHQVDQQNRVVERTIEGHHVKFVGGFLQVTGEDARKAGLTREAIVDILRAEATDKFEVLDSVDARKPIPVGAGK